MRKPKLTLFMDVSFYHKNMTDTTAYKTRAGYQLIF